MLFLLPFFQIHPAVSCKIKKESGNVKEKEFEKWFKDISKLSKRQAFHGLCYLLVQSELGKFGSSETKRKCDLNEIKTLKPNE